MNRIQSLGWSIRLLALTMGGSVSAMAIALLVVAAPRSRPVDAIAPLEPTITANTNTANTNSTIVPNAHSKPDDDIVLNTNATAVSPAHTAAMPNVDISGQRPMLSHAPHRNTEAIAQPIPFNPPTPDSPTSSSATPNSSTPDSSTLPLPLNLQDVVFLSLENNRTIKNAYLDRIIEQESLAVAEDRFNPDLTPQAQLGAERDDRGLNTATGIDVQLEAEMDVLLPTGTQFTITWQTDGVAGDTIGRNASNNNRLGQQIALTVTHPLWRDAGQAINRAPINLARFQDIQAQFELKSTLITTITAAIQRYYDLVLAQQRLKIQQDVLGRSEEELTRIDALITAGRLAAIRRVDAEAEVANRQVALLAAADSLRSAQLTLVQTLDIEQTVIPEATEMSGLAVSTIQFADNDRLVEYALANNPDYQAALLNLDIAAIQLLQAENNLQWDLDLIVSYINTLDNQTAERSDIRAGIQLSRELGDRTLKQQVIQQKTRIQQLENTRTEDRENLEIDVRNALRDVAFQQTQVEQAQRATRLAEQRLQNTQEQFRQGRGTTFFEVNQAQDDLVDAQNREVTAQVGYQNALANLDQQLGHTLETWNIQIFPAQGT